MDVGVDVVVFDYGWPRGRGLCAIKYVFITGVR